MKTIAVGAGEASYEVLVGTGLLDSVGDILQFDFGSAVVIEDAAAGALFGERLEISLSKRGRVERLTVESGERTKSWGTAGHLLEKISSFGLARNDVVIALGGGVAGDLAGFVAAAYMRGVRFVQVPTTLLAQVDAAIGGKTGVNLSAGKNLAGSFHQPSAVICDVTTLTTLPERQFRSGMAEVVKYGLCFDQELLSEKFLAADPGDALLLEDVVARCVRIKGEVISQDEKDSGLRMVLNYGHTLGHALEAAGGYSRLTHGEAISVGMMCAAHVAADLGMLDGSGVELHRRAAGRAGLPVSAKADPAEVAGFMEMDKKYDRSPRWVLLEGISNPVVRGQIEESRILTAMQKVLE